jgi:hypothetical protein
VACWYEGPPDGDLHLDFCPFAKAPTWRSGGPGGFSLRFPHAFCPQVDLMAATHRQVALAGGAALRALPTPPLARPLPRPDSAAALAPPEASPRQPQRARHQLEAQADGRQQQQQQQQQQQNSVGGAPFQDLQLSRGVLAGEPWEPSHGGLPAPPGMFLLDF